MRQPGRHGSRDVSGGPHLTVTAVPYAKISLAPADTLELTKRRLTTAFAPLLAASRAIRSIASALASRSNSVYELSSPPIICLIPEGRARAGDGTGDTS